jgi:hypothetical protein
MCPEGYERRRWHRVFAKNQTHRFCPGCRIGFCLSPSEARVPNADEYPEDSRTYGLIDEDLTPSASKANLSRGILECRCGFATMSHTQSDPVRCLDITGTTRIEIWISGRPSTVMEHRPRSRVSSESALYIWRVSSR